MIKIYKVMLHPNNKQATKLFLNADAARYAYNWAVAAEQENHKQNKPFIKEFELRKQFTKFKKTPEYNTKFDAASNNSMKQGIRDAIAAYKRFFNGKAKVPRFHSYRNTKPSFYQDPIKIKFTATHVRIENIAGTRRKSRERLNWIRLAEKNRIPTNAKYLNPRITFDGLHWWISVSIELPNNALNTNTTSGIGIDLGVKELAVLSNGQVFHNINKSERIRKLKRKERRLQRSVSRKFKSNNLELTKLNNTLKKGKRYKKTRNITKLQKQLLKLTRRIHNILQEHIRKAIVEIIKCNPKFIVIEDLAVSNMLKNRNLSKAIQAQKFGIFKRIIIEKSQEHHINLIIANRWYPSSKTCCKCGNIKHNLKLTDRVYKCQNCGNKIDRDLQAAINLRTYGERLFSN